MRKPDDVNWADYIFGSPGGGWRVFFYRLRFIAITFAIVAIVFLLKKAF
jgi:hypothetical protein